MKQRTVAPLLAPGLSISTIDLCDESTRLVQEVIDHVREVDVTCQRVSKKFVIPRLEDAALYTITARRLAAQFINLKGGVKE